MRCVTGVEASSIERIDWKQRKISERSDRRQKNGEEARSIKY